MFESLNINTNKISDDKTVYFTDDEGFYSNKTSPISQTNSKRAEFLNKQDKDIWESTLNYEISDYIDWDMKHK